MANLQYIGARYVPKFYENPNTGDMTWKSGVGYEPLTVVKYNDDTYTSKIPVPSSVGNPAANPIYWAKTSDFNAALVALQNSVSILQNEMPTKQTMPSDRYFIFCADSYNTHADGKWGNSTAKYLGLAADHYYIRGIGGASFSDGNILACVNQIVANCPIEPELVTDFVIGCGANEVADWVNTTTVTSAFTACRSAILASFPNAKIYVAFIGLDRNRMTNTQILEGMEMLVKQTYRDMTLSYKDCFYIGDVNNILRNYDYMNDDLLHPNTAGYNQIGYQTAKYFLGYDMSFNQNNNFTNEVYPLTGITIATKQRLVAQRDANYTHLYIGNLNFDCTWATADTNIDVIWAKCKLIRSSISSGGALSLGKVECNVRDSNNVWSTACLDLRLSLYQDVDNLYYPKFNLYDQRVGVTRDWTRVQIVNAHIIIPNEYL